MMKCQRCERPATFHITELTGEDVEEVHFCEQHAGQYLMQSDAEQPEETPSLAGALAQQLKIGQTAEELSRLDKQECPVCGITFFEFRNQGRLGCPHDYTCFAKDLEPLIINIQGETQHTGKQPKRGSVVTKQQTELIRMRREMKDAVANEEYEKASGLRDKIQQLEEKSN